MRGGKQVNGDQRGDTKEGRADASTDLIRVHRRLYERVKHALTEVRPPWRDPSVRVRSPPLLPGKAVRAGVVGGRITARKLLLGRE